MPTTGKGGGGRTEPRHSRMIRSKIQPTVVVLADVLPRVRLDRRRGATPCQKSP